MKMPPAPEWNPDFHYPQKSSAGRRRSERFFRLLCTGISGISVCVTCAIVTMPLGVATAIFLEEYQPKNRYLGVIHRWFELLISNLAGVPSIVYGLVGLTVFVYMFGLLGTVNRPNFEIGSSYYHQYLSLDRKRTLRIPVQ